MELLKYRPTPGDVVRMLDGPYPGREALITDDLGDGLFAMVSTNARWRGKPVELHQDFLQLVRRARSSAAIAADANRELTDLIDSGRLSVGMPQATPAENMADLDDLFAEKISTAGFTPATNPMVRDYEARKVGDRHSIQSSPASPVVDTPPGDRCSPEGLLSVTPVQTSSETSSQTSSQISSETSSETSSQTSSQISSETSSETSSELISEASTPLLFDAPGVTETTRKTDGKTERKSPRNKEKKTDGKAERKTFWATVSLYRSHGILYYRLEWGTGRYRIGWAHIPGGNWRNGKVQERRKQVQAWLAEDKPLEEIKSAIAGWRRAS